MFQASPRIERRPDLEAVPGLRVSRVRRRAPASARRSDGTLHVLVEAPAGSQPMILYPDPRPYGPRFLAQCACGRRVAVLRLDSRTGWWRCARCLGLRCAKSRHRHNHTFNTFVRPVLDLERARRRLMYPRSPHAKRRAFALLDKQLVARLSGQSGGPASAAAVKTIAAACVPAKKGAFTCRM